MHYEVFISLSYKNKIKKWKRTVSDKVGESPPQALHGHHDHPPVQLDHLVGRWQLPHNDLRVKRAISATASG